MKLYYKKDNCMVEVYHFFEDRTALIFNPSLAGRCNGTGWDKVKISSLIPEEYADTYKKGFTSTTEKNKIKKRLTLSYAEWTCTDGKIFNSCDDAIEHERKIMIKEAIDNAELKE